MKITENAKQLLETIFQERNAEGIRVYSLGSGCCGPQIGLSLDAPMDADIVQEVNGIKVAIDPQISSSVEHITLDKENTADGTGFVLIGGSECC
ncbi:adhesin [Metabacillus idriensis]|uniref:Adhesin n=1 Tax=Metabacillus idriensis TaxID=324768 RepID=A0A6I2M7R3_9BACI|nr:adhesin [Metabacillus idriensis]MCM3595504.1 adhesin [Metabacillus idriensis]MRX52471.1 adhesin [Metabacillus idriensis]